MTESLQEQRKKLIEIAISNDQLNDDLLKIDNSLDKELFNYNSPFKRFQMKMCARNITVSGDYESHKSILSFVCEKCKHEWEGSATHAQKIGCPECFRFTSNLEKTVIMWDRSKKIIRDKIGKILQLPEIIPGKPPSLEDEFILGCSRGHTFTFTHHRLRDNLWCPQCRSKYGLSDEPVSNYVYRRGMTEEEKFVKYSEIAEMKGAKILSLEPDSKAFKIVCKTCQKTRILTARQICNNQYLCKHRCVKGNKYTIYKDAAR